MKTYLYTNLLLVILGSVLTVYQVYSPTITDYLGKINIYHAKVIPTDQGVKTQIHVAAGLTFWLSETGEIHSIKADTARHFILNEAIKEWQNITYIEDFCLDADNDRIYFTDMMDLKSGKGTIKVSDLQGKHLRTLFTLQDAIPYQVSLSSSGKSLFYLSQSDFQDASYQLRMINLSNGEQRILHTSTQKISQLTMDHSLKMLSITDPAQGQLAFTTANNQSNILAEAIPWTKRSEHTTPTK